MIRPSERPPLTLVTGSAKRLGKAMALAMARAGWDVIVHYHRSREAAQETANQVRQMGRQAWAIQADLTSPTEAAGLISACLEQAGLPRCLINSASLFEFDNPQDFRTKDLNRHMTLNLNAPLILSRELFAATRQAMGAPPGAGVIINLLDQKLINLNPDFLSYTLSKAALETATQLLARSFAPWLRVVGLAPGITLPSGAQSEQEFIEVHHRTPLGHASFPEDIAQAAVFLASAASITGTTLYVDGGQHLLTSDRDIMFKA